MTTTGYAAQLGKLQWQARAIAIRFGADENAPTSAEHAEGWSLVGWIDGRPVLAQHAEYGTMNPCRQCGTTPTRMMDWRGEDGEYQTGICLRCDDERMPTGVASNLAEDDNGDE